jgi:diacylglycerol kinase family enzyme
MDRAVLIANPGASQFTGGLHRTAVRELRRRFDVDPIWPHDADDARRLAGEAAREGASVVVAMGGDGIVHHVAQGVIGTEASLGIVPAGTTNVVARLLGIPSRPQAAVRLLAREPVETLRTAVVETALDLDGVTLRRSAVFSVGAGVDAEVVEAADQEPYRKYRFGSVHYARTALGVVWRDFRGRRPDVTVAAGSHLATGLGFMAQFRDVYTYFGRVPLRLSPAPPDPMHVLVPESIRMRRVLAILRGAVGGSGLGGVAGFSVWENVGRIRFTAESPVLVQADGELLGRATEGTVVHRPDALAVLVPQSAVSSPR